MGADSCVFQSIWTRVIIQVEYFFRGEMKPHNLPKLSFLVVATALWVSACSLGNPAATEAPPPPSATAPESTPTALVPLVIRLAAEDAEPGLQAQVDQIVQTFAAEGGYRFEMRQALTA